jgi:hypothetical protein
MFEYRFDWDPAKAARNVKDHGVTFEQAASVFLDAHLLSQVDEAHEEHEERWLSLGLDKSGRLLVVWPYVSRGNQAQCYNPSHIRSQS